MSPAELDLDTSELETHEWELQLLRLLESHHFPEVRNAEKVKAMANRGRGEVEIAGQAGQNFFFHNSRGWGYVFLC